MLASVTIILVYLVLGLPAALIALPWALLTRNINRVYRWGTWIANFGLKVGGVRIEIEGRDRLDPGTQYIFMSNHVSNLDPPVLLPILPGRTTIFLKSSLMKIPVLGYAMGLADFIPVERDGRVESAKQNAEQARKALDSGLHVTVFVEGTRSRDGRLLPFKKGPFFFAMQANAPIVPISIWGTESMMKKGSLRIQPGTAHVIFHEPIMPHAYATREDLTAAVRASIASALPERMQPLAEPTVSE